MLLYERLLPDNKLFPFFSRFLLWTLLAFSPSADADKIPFLKISVSSCGYLKTECTFVL